jgi:enoyl-CoA hydratase
MEVIYEKKNGIAYITMNRPEALNAMDPEMAVQLADTWLDFRDDESLRCAIITGAGDRAFSVGGDLKKLLSLVTGARKPETEADKRFVTEREHMEKFTLRDFDLYKPVIAAVNGHVIAAGFELLLNTDIRVASEKAQFGFQEVKWGLYPGGGCTVRLWRQIPFVKTMELLLTGELIDAQEAYRLGVVNCVVPVDKVMEEAERFANIIVKNGPLAVSGTKQSILKSMGIPVSAGLAIETAIADQIWQTEDAQEGLRAFREKREPRFKGK